MNKQGKIWGFTSLIQSVNNVEIHYCEVVKGGYCSIHKHDHKYNKFVVLDGILQVTIFKQYEDKILEDVSVLRKGDECTVPPGDNHKFECFEDAKILEVYWVSIDHSDIVRQSVGGRSDAEKANICKQEQDAGASKCSLRKAIL